MMSFSDSDRIIEDAYRKLRRYAPEQYAWLNADPEKRKDVTESARAVAIEQIELSKVPYGQSLVGIDNLLSKYLTDVRITMLRQGFHLETFSMNLDKTSDGMLLVEMTREGSMLEPPKAVLESQSMEWAIVKLYASIFVEAYFLVMSLAGIKPPIKTYVDKVLNNAARSINTSSKLRKALEEFVRAWNEAGGNAFKKATALFNLIKDSGAMDAFWSILEAMMTNMDRYDWLKTALNLTTIVIAAVATEGVALIAEIASIVSDAKDFAKKIIKLNELRKKRS